MNNLLFILILTLLHSQLSFGTQIKKEDWVKVFKENLSAYMCQPNQATRKCFGISEKECISSIKTGIKSCFKNHHEDIPNILNLPKDGTYWGTILGKCTGGIFFDKNKNRAIDGYFLDNQKCKESIPGF